MRNWLQCFYLFICLFNKHSSMFLYLCSDALLTPFRFQNAVLYSPHTPNVYILYIPISFRWLPLLAPPICFRSEHSWVEGMAKEGKSWRKRLWRRKSHHCFWIFSFLHSHYYPIPICNMVGLTPSIMSQPHIHIYYLLVSLCYVLWDFSILQCVNSIFC